jgi:hypothetical protein
MFLNKSNSWGSLYFTRKLTDKPTPNITNIDVLPSLPDKLRAESERKTKEKKVAIPGESLLKKLHKQQKKKKVVDSETDDAEMERYTKSINNLFSHLDIGARN